MACHPGCDPRLRLLRGRQVHLAAAALCGLTGSTGLSGLTHGFCLSSQEGGIQGRGRDKAARVSPHDGHPSVHPGSLGHFCDVRSLPTHPHEGPIDSDRDSDRADSAQPPGSMVARGPADGAQKAPLRRSDRVVPVLFTKVWSTKNNTGFVTGSRQMSLTEWEQFLPHSVKL